MYGKYLRCQRGFALADGKRTGKNQATLTRDSSKLIRNESFKPGKNVTSCNPTPLRQSPASVGNFRGIPVG